MVMITGCVDLAAKLSSVPVLRDTTGSAGFRGLRACLRFVALENQITLIHSDECFAGEPLL